MLDSDLAKLYECSNGTKDINKAVKRNIERFPESFMFKLTREECNIFSRFQNGTLKGRGHNIKYLPYVFTEQGVAMLSSVLRTSNAIKIIDGYADNTILDIIKRLNVKVTIITKSNNLLTNQDISKYNKQYNNLTVKFNNTFHDRYFILDNDVIYHCGASINRVGYKTFSITKINDEEVKNALINKI